MVKTGHKIILYWTLLCNNRHFREKHFLLIYACSAPMKFIKTFINEN